MKKLLALLLMLVLLLTLTGCAATEEPLVKKDEIVKRVVLEQLKGPEEAGTYNASFYCPVTDPKQFQTAFFGDRPSELRETGYGYEVKSTTDGKEYLRTYSLTNGMENGKWIGSLQTDCIGLRYQSGAQNGNGYSYLKTFMYYKSAIQGTLRSAMRSKSADREVLQAAEQDSARILRDLSVGSFKIRYSAGYMPSDFDRLAALSYQHYPELPTGPLYIVEYEIAPDRKPAGIRNSDSFAYFLYDEDGLISAHISFGTVAEQTGNVYTPCTAEEAYRAAIADWYEPGAILADMWFEFVPTGITEGAGSLNYVGQHEGYWKLLFLYPTTNDTILEFQLRQLGEYCDEVTGYYEVQQFYVDARTGTKMSGQGWNGSTSGKQYIHRYNSWGQTAK